MGILPGVHLEIYPVVPLGISFGISSKTPSGIPSGFLEGFLQELVPNFVQGCSRSSFISSSWHFFYDSFGKISWDFSRFLPEISPGFRKKIVSRSFNLLYLLLKFFQRLLQISFNNAFRDFFHNSS